MLRVRLLVVSLLLCLLAAPAFAQQPVFYTLQSSATTGDGQIVDTTGYTLATVYVSTAGGFDRTVTFSMCLLTTCASTDFFAISCKNTNTLLQGVNTTASGIYACSIGGAKQFKAAISGGTTGTATVTARLLSNAAAASAGANLLPLQAGTLAAPGLPFAAYPQSGLYRDVANNRLGIAEGLSLPGSQLVLTALADPAAPTITNVGTTGATTYSYKVVAKNGAGVTVASAAGSTTTGNATLSSTNYNVVTLAAVISAATGYDIYRTAGGATQGLIGSIALGATTTFNDTGLAGDASTAPATNTTGTLTVPKLVVLQSTIVNGVTIAAQAVGFTAFGGTTSKQLTVDLDLTASRAISLTGTANRISVGAGTTLSVGGSVGTIDIAAGYVGQTSITTLGTITTGTWNATLVALAFGGTNANLTASTGGIFYSTATAGAILSGTATALQMLQSGASAAPTWSSATWPVTTTINQLLYSSAANTVAGLATVNNGLLLTSAAGVPSITACATTTSVLQGGSPPACTTTPTISGLTTFQTNPLITNTAPGLVFTNTTGAAKSLTVALPGGNIVDLRESAGASGSLLVLDLANNRVGIGTTGPGYKLHVVGSANDVIYLENPTNTAFVRTKVTGGVNISEWSFGPDNLGDTTAGFSLYSRTAAAYRMFINGSGNVGIGTTTFGTSLAGGLALSTGTAPTTSPAGIMQQWAANWNGAATAALFGRSEEGNVSTIFGSKWGINNTVPFTELTAASTGTGAIRGISSAQYNTGTQAALFDCRKARGTQAAPTTIVTGDILCDHTAEGYEGTSYLLMAKISMISEGTIATTRVPTRMEFSTATDVAPSVLTLAMKIDSAQNVSVQQRLTSNGSLATPKKAIAFADSPYTVGGTDLFITCDATNGAVVINFPAVSAVPGRQLWVVKTDSSANNCTPTRAGADTFILGGTTDPLTVQGKSMIYASDGTSVWTKF